MKNKLRNISVNNIEYKWSITGKGLGEDDGYDYGMSLHIWKNKNKIYQKNMDYLNQITPKLVSEIIKEISNFEKN